MGVWGYFKRTAKRMYSNARSGLRYMDKKADGAVQYVWNHTNHIAALGVREGVNAGAKIAGEKIKEKAEQRGGKSAAVQAAVGSYAVKEGGKALGNKLYSKINKSHLPTTHLFRPWMWGR